MMIIKVTIKLISKMKDLKTHFLFTVLVSGVLFCGCGRFSPIEKRNDGFTYPLAHRDSVVDDYHGTKVPDPYRWLEDPDSAQTQNWVAEQNKLTSQFVSSVPAGKKIKVRLKNLMNYPRYSSPYKRAGRYFFWKNDGLQNQSVLYSQQALDDRPDVVINPNLLSKDGTVAVSTTAVSENGDLLAYGLSRSGSDRQEIKIRSIDSGKDYEEILEWCRFTSIAWKHDNTGFFYNRFPDPCTVPVEDQTNYNRVYWHKLATPQSQDKLIYERPDNKELGFAPIITEDGKFLILHVYHGTSPKNRIYYRPVESTESFIRLLDQADAGYDFIGNVGSIFYFKTDLDTPRGRIIAVDTANPSRRNWHTILPQTEDVIDYVALINNRFVVAYMHDVHHQLKIYGLDGDFVREIPLPALGRVDGLSGKQDDTEMFFSFTSFLFPATNYRYDFLTDQLLVFQKPKIDFDSSDYRTKQVFYHSKDGTRVPMFITHRKDIKLDGSNPTLLYGYGGFNINIKPSFSASVISWLEMGGVYCVANLRGGSEYGETWHQAGMLDKKQNVFDDFISAAEWLTANKYTTSKKLAIRGGSNGGLLVAACMLQRPELFGAVVCQVPVADMLRYHKFTVGRYWVPEYGNAEASPEHFKFLYAYSPLHNVGDSVDYPPILVTSADTDDRVVPSHAKKFVAALQAKAAGKNPILLRVDTKAGHGGGKPITKVIEEQADIYAFLFKVLDM
ncbi:MAG: S9 family peptidase [Sedimentisphaerales bacterium]|nr:S9 family peptidase [Sedimentisphaerales bacterium]